MDNSSTTIHTEPAFMTPATQPLPPDASRLRRVLRAFALDDWFRVVSFPNGKPDNRELWRNGGVCMLWFLSGCAAMCGGFYLFWPIFLFVPYAGWKTLRYWSMTFYMRLRGRNRWLFSNYARAFAGCVRVFAALWAVCMVTTPLRPMSSVPPPADLVESIASANPEMAKKLDGILPPAKHYAITANAGNDSVLGRGITQILESPFSSFLFGYDHAAQRSIAEARRAWAALIYAAPAERRDEMRTMANSADLAHPLIGRGGIPHLLDNWCFHNNSPKARAAYGLIDYWVFGILSPKAPASRQPENGKAADSK